MKRAAFLDRDGTINEDVGHITDPAQFELIPGAIGAIRRLKEAGYFLVLVTNQAGVGRGLMTEPQLRRVLDAFEDCLRTTVSVSMQSGIAHITRKRAKAFTSGTATAESQHPASYSMPLRSTTLI